MRRLITMTIVLMACAAGKPQPEADVLRVPDGGSLIAALHAQGAQVYECRDGTKWELKGPDAELRDDSGSVVGRHYGGPTWESNDGSKVVGEVVGKKPMPGGIPWLLLAAKSFEGRGVFSRVTFIQRVDTKGGAAPEGSCRAGAEMRVDYTATYKFYGRG
jgi:hypothetical protein